MTHVDLVGYAAAIAVAATYAMQTMIPLRVAGIVSNCLFIAYGVMNNATPILALHLFLLPLNGWRLYQMVRLVRRVTAAATGDFTVDWLRPFMNTRRVRAGEVIFRQGDVADAVYYTVSGEFRLMETGMGIFHGDLIGELGLFSPDHRRTMGFQCTRDGELLTMSYQQIKQLFFQNPQFGFALVRLLSERLFNDVRRLDPLQAETGRRPPSPPAPLPDHVSLQSPAARSDRP